MKKLFIILVLAGIASLSSVAKTFTIGNYQFDLPSTYEITEELTDIDVMSYASIESLHCIDLYSSDMLAVYMIDRDEKLLLVKNAAKYQNSKIKSGKENGTKYKYFIDDGCLFAELSFNDFSFVLMFMSNKNNDNNTIKSVIASFGPRQVQNRPIVGYADKFKNLSLIDIKTFPREKRVAVLYKYHEVPIDVFTQEDLEMLPSILSSVISTRIQNDPKILGATAVCNRIDILLFDMNDNHILTTTVYPAEIKAKQDRKNSTSRYSF